MARKTARLGRQTPTQALVLPYDETKGGEAVELYEQGGRTAMDWQKVLLYDMMAVDDDGLWVHSKFGLSVPRRNGKSEVDKMRELRGLFHSEHTLHTAHRTTTKHSACIFTNVPLAGDDARGRTRGSSGRNFYPRPPCGGRPANALALEFSDPISIHVPLAGDDVKPDHISPRVELSIHVPLAGDDLDVFDDVGNGRHISIHVPLAGDDGKLRAAAKRAKEFLSTSPLRGTTPQIRVVFAYKPFLSTSPLRGTTASGVDRFADFGISIHVPLAGDDPQVQF